MELPSTDRLADAKRDALYNYDDAANKVNISKKPWRATEGYFRTVRISAVALIKMVMHARSGGNLEVMGLMQGYIDGTALVVTDAFRLPVEGTETRVNAHEDANEYMVDYPKLCREESRAENILGWYHSHPGYGCWLSGVDVQTESMHQMFNDPFVAVVIDPNRTISASKVEIGAFRTYNEMPEHSEAAAPGGGGMAGADGTVPMAKVEDFGAHANKYYALEVEHFKSTLDSRLLELLWNKYWVQTLAQNPLLTNRDYASSQMNDLALRVNKATTAVLRGAGSRGPLPIAGGGTTGSSGGGSTSVFDATMEKLARDASQIAAKERAGLAAADVKAQVFGGES